VTKRSLLSSICTALFGGIYLIGGAISAYCVISEVFHYTSNVPICSHLYLDSFVEQVKSTVSRNTKYTDRMSKWYTTQYTCQAHSLFENARPHGCWLIWRSTSFDEGDYESCAGANATAYAAKHIWRRFSRDALFGSPNGGSTSCEDYAPFVDRIPDSVLCVVTLTTESGFEPESLHYLRCETDRDCSLWGSSRHSGDCCQLLYVEPVRDGGARSSFDDSIFADKFNKECFEYPIKDSWE
jgi:hypothetical protein